MKYIFYTLFYISILFLFYYLYKENFLSIPQIHNYYFLLLSFLLLFTGKIIQCMNWNSVLNILNLPIAKKDAITSVGLSIFMKYLPGKILANIGRATYISNKYHYPLLYTSYASVFSQAIILWAGILIGMLFLLSGKLSVITNTISIILFIFFTILIIYPRFINYSISFIYKMKNQEHKLFSLSINDVLYILPTFVSTWLLWSVGFYFLIAALHPGFNSLLIAFSFPLATTLSIMAFFTPGGLGIREGLLVTFLILFSFTSNEATTIALFSRLWFLIGELFLFIIALYYKLFSNNFISVKNPS